MYTKKTEDEDIGQMFFDSLDKEIKDIYNSIKYRGKMVCTDDDKVLFIQAKTCHICNRKIEGEKVRDHCPITGQFKHAATANET